MAFSLEIINTYEDWHAHLVDMIQLESSALEGSIHKCLNSYTANDNTT